MIDSIKLVGAISDFLSAEYRKADIIYPAINTETDPYAKFECLIKATPEPLALIESETENFTRWSLGAAHSSTHKVTINCIVNVNGRAFKDYRRAAQDLANQVRVKLEEFGDNKISMNAMAQTRGEFLVGSIKCSGVIIEYDVL